MGATVTLKRTNGTALVTLHRQEAYNAFDLEMVRQLADTMTSLALDQRITGVVLAGEGKAFCAGGDLRWAHEYPGELPQAFHKLAAHFHQAILEIRRMPKPVVAAINGMAAGGGFSLALACDFRIMETSALLRQAYTSSGLSIDGAGTHTLPRLVGLARALEIAGLDQPIDSETAKAWGLVTEVVADGECVQRATAFLEEWKHRSLTSFAASKRLLMDSYHTALEVQLERERGYLSWCAGQPDGVEGVQAFLEKRRPAFNKG
jgi:2-(1,2-epoxy-1,2-dihydrophenyl)acetyl-CoA isomerase